MKGHIRERSPGHWAIVIDVRDPTTGKRRWHSLAGTKRQAQIECARLISEMESGAVVDPSRIRLPNSSTDLSATGCDPYRCQDRRALPRCPRACAPRAWQCAASESPARRRCRALCHAKPLRFSTTPRRAKTWGVIRDNVTEVIKPQTWAKSPKYRGKAGFVTEFQLR